MSFRPSALSCPRSHRRCCRSSRLCRGAGAGSVGSLLIQRGSWLAHFLPTLVNVILSEAKNRDDLPANVLLRGNRDVSLRSI